MIAHKPTAVDSGDYGAPEPTSADLGGHGPPEPTAANPSQGADQKGARKGTAADSGVEGQPRPRCFHLASPTHRFSIGFFTTHWRPLDRHRTDRRR